MRKEVIMPKIGLDMTLDGVLVEIVAEEGEEVEITKTIAWVEVDE